jgi:hypothetical protein
MHAMKGLVARAQRTTETVEQRKQIKQRHGTESPLPDANNDGKSSF